MRGRKLKSFFETKMVKGSDGCWYMPICYRVYTGSKGRRVTSLIRSVDEVIDGILYYRGSESTTTFTPLQGKSLPNRQYYYKLEKGITLLEAVSTFPNESSENPYPRSLKLSRVSLEKLSYDRVLVRMSTPEGDSSLLDKNNADKLLSSLETGRESLQNLYEKEYV